VEINNGVYLIKSYIRQVPLFISGCLGLVILILGLVSSVLGLGLFTSLV